MATATPHTPNHAPTVPMGPVNPNEVALDLRKDALMTVPGQLRTDKHERGNNTFVGLSLESDNKSYVFRDVDTVREQRVERVKMGKLQVAHKVGNSVQLGRKPEQQKYEVDELTYTVDIFNSLGEMVDIVTVRESEFNKFVDDRAIKKASWEVDLLQPAPNPNTSPTGPERLEIDLPRKRDGYFDAVTAQLEEQNITDWTGLLLRTGANKQKVGNHTLQITRETLLIDRTGVRTKPLLSHVLKEYDDALRCVSVKVLKDASLQEYLNDPGTGPLSEISMLRHEEVTEAVDMEAIATQRQTLENMISDQSADYKTNKDEIARNRAARKDQQTEDACIWLLSYVDSLVGSDQASHDARLGRMSSFYDKVVDQSPILPHESVYLGDEYRRQETLKEIIDKYGLVKVVDLAVRLQNEFIESTDVLRLPVTNGNASISWIIEGLTDKYYYSTHPSIAGNALKGVAFGDPFEDTVEAQKLQRDVIDTRIGTMFLGEVIKPDVKLKPTGKVHPNSRQPIYTEEPFLDYRKSYFDAIQKLVRRPVRDISDMIFERLSTNKEIGQKDVLSLGRWLRRSLGK